jgi:thymidine phosphorylase
VAAIDGWSLGLLAMELGAGRRDRNDVLDLGVGIRVLARVGQAITEGQPVYRVYAKAGASLPLDRYLATLQLQAGPATPTPWLLATIGC